MTSDIIPISAGAVSPFESRDPTQIVQKATAIANALVPIIKQRKLAVKIGQSEHVRVEAWTACGAMLNLFASVEKPVQYIQDGDDWGYAARVVIHDPDGREYGSAEAECWASEDNWKTKDRFELKSMAQTRAVSKAFRMPLSWIIVLAGYEATPAEEMTSVARRAAPTAQVVDQRRSPAQSALARTTAGTVPSGAASCPHHPDRVPSKAWSGYTGTGSARFKIEGRKCTGKMPDDSWCPMLFGNDGYWYENVDRSNYRRLEAEVPQEAEYVPPEDEGLLE
jgi:hypothetical protein